MSVVIHQVFAGRGRSKRLKRGTGLALAAALGAVGLVGLVPAAPAQAATYEVTSGADSGPGSLRDTIDGIDPADADPVVTIQAGLTIMLESPIDIPDTLTLRGGVGEKPVITFDEDEWYSGGVFAQDGPDLRFIAEGFAVRGHADGAGNETLWSDLISGNHAETAVVELRDMELSAFSSVVGVGNTPEANVLIEDSTFSDIGPYRDGEGYLVELSQPFGGSLTVRNSTFERMWVHLAWTELGAGHIEIDGASFDNGGLGAGENPTGVLAIDFQGGADPNTVPVVIRNSTFSGLGGDESGAMYFSAQDGQPVGAPVAAEITGCTFVNTYAGDELANAFVMDVADPDTAIVVRNSTFLMTPREADGASLVGQIRDNQARLIMEYVTSKGVGISADERAVVTLRDSAFLTEASGIIMHEDDQGEIEAGGSAFPPLDISEVVIERTVVSNPGMRFPDLTATPEADFALGDLANNGGPTQTMLPGPGSVLLDAAEGELPTDQRGLPRPVGASADAGAVEVQVSTVALEADVTVPEGKPLVFVATRTGGRSWLPSYGGVPDQERHCNRRQELHERSWCAELGGRRYGTETGDGGLNTGRRGHGSAHVQPAA